MTDEGADLGTKLAGDAPTARGAALLADRGTWAAAGCVVVGTVLVAAAFVPAVVYGPINPYAAAILIALGLGALAGGCAVEAYGLVRRYASTPLAILAALVACTPPLAPMFQPGGGGDLTVPLAWMVLLALATLLVRRSRAAWILAAVTFVPVLGLVGLSLAN
jgi:hypothetical protein